MSAHRPKEGAGVSSLARSRWTQSLADACVLLRVLTLRARLRHGQGSEGSDLHSVQNRMLTAGQIARTQPAVLGVLLDRRVIRRSKPLTEYSWTFRRHSWPPHVDGEESPRTRSSCGAIPDLSADVRPRARSGCWDRQRVEDARALPVEPSCHACRLRCRAESPVP
jgi:hypothetical protein